MSGPYGMQHLKNQYCSNCKRKKLEDRGHSKIPWDRLLVASVRVILRHHGITSGSLVIDDTANSRSKAAKTLAYLYKLRDKESGGYLWGQRLVFLLLVTPKISIPVGFVFYR